METYKLRYDILKKEIGEYKINKKNIKTNMDKKIEEQNETYMVLLNDTKEQNKLKFEIEKVVNNKDKVINVITTIMLIITLLLTIFLGINIISNMIEISMNLLAEIGIIIGLGNAYAIVFTIILAISDVLKEKLHKRNMKNPNIKNLLKKLSIKNNEVNKTEQKVANISKEIQTMKEEIKKTEAIIDTKTIELQKLKQEMTKILINIPEDVVENYQEEEQNVGYKRIRKI